MKITQFLPAILVATGVTLAATSMPASAIVLSFNNISGGDIVGDAYASKFSLDVTQSSTNKVLFKFLNSVTGGTSAIKQVAFSVDSNVSNLLSNIGVNVNNVGTVDFKSDTANLPQSNLISGWDGVTFGAKTDKGNNNAVQAGESLGIELTANYNAVIAALTARTLQVGIHVGSLPDDASDSYVNANPTTPVPEPITILGLGVGTIGGGLMKRKFGNKAKATA